MSRGKVLAVGVFVALVSVTSAWAQTVSSTTGAINGKATDESGAGMPGVTVTAVSESMQGSRTDVTGEDGAYRFPAVPPGTYKLTYRAQRIRHRRPRGRASSASGSRPRSTPR